MNKKLKEDRGVNLEDLLDKLRSARKHFVRDAMSKDIVGSHDYTIQRFEGFEEACNIVWKWVINQPRRAAHGRIYHPANPRRIQ